MTCSIATLRAKGITFEAGEAVAIAQQLISDLIGHHAGEVDPPHGPPSVDNVWLHDDGSVVCRGCRTTPAVSEVGIFLETLLPPGAARVPGGLRYTIARALLNVDVPPFDSLTDLSRDLQRHERGQRASVVRGVLARASGQPTATLALVERRRSRASARELRRALREADARWYEHRPPAPPPTVLDIHPSLPPRDRTTTATAACLAAGLALICTGEFMHRQPAPALVTQTVPAVAPATPEVAPAAPVGAPDVPVRGGARGTVAVRDVPSSATVVSRPVARRLVVKHASARRSTPVVRRPVAASRSLGSRQGKPPSRGVLDRLRLGWLRSAFSVHSDL